MRKLFVSYARENKRDIDQLVDHLELMGYETWVDFRLRGGQDWWEEILRRIASSDVFIAVISSAALVSTACRREFDWAEAVHRPVLPIAVEPIPYALPGRFARRQIIDYSQPAQRDRAALRLAGGLTAVAAAPPLPAPLPHPPLAPLSYLTDLVDLVTQFKPMNPDEKQQVLRQIEVALRSVDPEERRGGHDVLTRFAARADVDSSTRRALAELLGRQNDTTFAPRAPKAEAPRRTRRGSSGANSGIKLRWNPGGQRNPITDMDEAHAPWGTYEKRDHRPDDRGWYIATFTDRNGVKTTIYHGPSRSAPYNECIAHKKKMIDKLGL